MDFQEGLSVGLWKWSDNMARAMRVKRRYVTKSSLVESIAAINLHRKFDVPASCSLQNSASQASPACPPVAALLSPCAMLSVWPRI